MAETVNELIKEIKSSLGQDRSSQKDEIRVMRAMLNDTSYEVDVYGKSGVEGTYNPAKDFRGMMVNIVSNTTKVSREEAAGLVENYDVRKTDAETMVNVSKQFIDTFVHTGRKLPIGGRAESNVSLSLKTVPTTTRVFNKKVGVNDDGSNRYVGTPVTIPAHEGIRVHAPCPSWVKL